MQAGKGGKMKTSYYQNTKLKSGKFYPVRISIGHPRFGTQPAAVLSEAAPTTEMLAKGYTDVEYMALLDSHADTIIKRLNAMPDNAVFLCFEKDAKQCHRSWFAEWLYEVTGEAITEL